jgi:membrane associated rhomboid family serine protease
MIPLHDDNPTRTRPYVTLAIIAACTVVFLWQITHSQQVQQYIAYALGFVPAVAFGSRQLPPELHVLPAGLTVFTAMFLHGGWLHLIGNMLYLWIFGDNVEDAMGHGRFLLFYLICGLAAALVQGLSSPGSTIPMIGASGAISGVLGAYLLLHPRARVLVLVPLGFFFFTIFIPAALVLGLWFLLQLLSSASVNPDEGGVAFFAHVGGFLTGLALIPFFRRKGVPLWASPRR